MLGLYINLVEPHTLTICTMRLCTILGLYTNLAEPHTVTGLYVYILCWVCIPTWLFIPMHCMAQYPSHTVRFAGGGYVLDHVRVAVGCVLGHYIAIGTATATAASTAHCDVVLAAVGRGAWPAVRAATVTVRCSIARVVSVAATVGFGVASVGRVLRHDACAYRVS